MKKKIHLAFDLSWTTVETHWRLPGSWVDRHHPNIGMFEEVARTAERGGFDMIFFGDSTGIPDTWKGSIEDAVRNGVAWPRFEMSPWIAMMSRVTSHLGFGLTYASTFMHPFYTARLLNSLDHVTNGRIAFNVITSQRRADYANYGYDELVDHNERYDRLEEFIDVCRALWSSVDADAFVWDRKRHGGGSAQGPPDQPRRQVLQGQGAAQRRALAAGSAGHHPGRRLAARNGRGGACGGSCLRH